MGKENHKEKLIRSASGEDEPDFLRSKILGSSAWVLGGYGLSQAIRLGGNLILTRLLFPEAFGLMALISVIILGVTSFSDIGIRTNIIQNSRGNEMAFLDTAWTLQILRACIIFFLVCLFAQPAAIFYGAPQLAYLMPFVGFAALIEGCSSTALSTLARQISLRGQVLIEIYGRIVGLILMVIIAWFWRSVWALVIGSLFASTFQMVLSHFLISGYRNRLRCDREAAKAIISFGKWIFVATLLTFLGGQGDRLVLGKLFDSNTLGVYSVAFILSQTIVRACHKLSINILFPLYTQLAKQDITAFRKKLTKIRGVILLFALPPTWALAIWGEYVVDFFYDTRYIDAGWMLEILAIRAIARTIIITEERILLSRGDSFRHMLLQLSRVVLLMIGMYLGNLYAGVAGLLTGMVIASFVEYLVLAALINRYGVWQPRLDMLAFGLSAGIIFLGKYLT